MSDLSHRKGTLIIMALHAVDVPIFTGDAFLIYFAIPRRAVDADVEDCATTERRERKLFGGGLGDSLLRSLGLRFWILL